MSVASQRSSRAPGPVPSATGVSDEDPGVESNSRLTAMTAAVLLVLFAIEGVTLVHVRSLLSVHVFVGALLVPPVLLKMGTTGYRFARYYRGSAAYRRKGPPALVLRLLGPFVVVTTVTVLGSGIALMLVPGSLRHLALSVHKASFVLWFAAMTVHVLGHAVETAKIAPRDWVRRGRAEVHGASLRQWVLVGSVALGVPVGLVLLGTVGPWLAAHNGH